MGSAINAVAKTLRGPFVAALLIGIADTACKYWVPEFGSFLIYAATLILLTFSGQMTSGLHGLLCGLLGQAHAIPVDGRGLLKFFR